MFFAVQLSIRGGLQLSFTVKLCLMGLSFAVSDWVHNYFSGFSEVSQLLFPLMVMDVMCNVGMVAESQEMTISVASFSTC